MISFDKIDVYTFLIIIFVLVLLYNSFISILNYKDQKRTLKIKESNIKELIAQNKELKVQLMIINGGYTKEEAVKLIYGKSLDEIGRQQDE